MCVAQKDILSKKFPSFKMNGLIEPNSILEISLRRVFEIYN